MTADSENNVFGRTLVSLPASSDVQAQLLSVLLQNPYKLSLTAGGSSGGEGALVGMRGSLIGVGTDIGGSIRIPALCCGTFGFKPTTDRIPMGGQANPVRDGKLPYYERLTSKSYHSCFDLQYVVSFDLLETALLTD